MKTPQQIKNEVEKEIEELKEEAEKELIIYKEEKDFFERRKQYSSLQNIIIKLREREAKLSILTEYDKSIKEMIEDYFNFQMDYFSRPPTEINKAIVLLIANMKQELLSKLNEGSK